MGGSSIRDTGVGRLRGRLLLGVGAALFVAGAAILAVGIISYLDDGQASVPARQSQAFPDSPNYSEIDLEGFEHLPVAIPYYNPQRTLILPEPEPEAQVAAPLRMVIESIDVDAPVNTYGLDATGVPQVPTAADAPDVVAWYDFSTRPGEGSNAVFAGHVNWAGAPAVFGDLDQLQPGDTVRLMSDDGREFTYEVFDNFPVDASDPASLKVMAPTETDTITIITCGGTWIPDPSEEFGGSYPDRTIVQAKLVESSLAAPVPSAISDG